MEPLQPPSEVEIKAAYDQGKEAVVALINATFRKMAERIQQLEDRVAKNSSNSGKPPSSDGLAKKPKSLRHKSGKKSGGQVGHPGSTQSKPLPINKTVVSPDSCYACSSTCYRRSLIPTKDSTGQRSDFCKAPLRDDHIRHNVGKQPLQIR
jgi:hypothetical protein